MVSTGCKVWCTLAREWRWIPTEIPQGKAAERKTSRTVVYGPFRAAVLGGSSPLSTGTVPLRPIATDRIPPLLRVMRMPCRTFSTMGALDWLTLALVVITAICAYWTFLSPIESDVQDIELGKRLTATVRQQSRPRKQKSQQALTC